MGGATVVGAAAPGIAERIGRYRIRRLIGAGGMGSVYEAIQEQPRRTVALKVLSLRMGNPAALRRFEYEAQVLARLRHPSIAQVYEAGTHTDPATGAVVPYFAMEYVPGAEPLTDHAAGKHLNVRERLELFTKVCDAVHHGHLKGVIHRDLKPANILVDSAGQPKVIDFGVARAADGDMALATFETQVGQLIGTVQYMSPEQCAADPTDIDARSDVYALGVVLYQLLAGELPYDLSGRSIVEAAQIVQHEPPTRLSRAGPALRGDIETIVHKALEKERGARYESAAALAADIGRSLRDEPILARPIGAGGRLVRWVRRNRALATAVGAAACVLVIVSAVLMARIIAESGRATRALAAAEQNLRAAQDNFGLVRDLFGSMRPDQLKQGFVDLEDLLDRAEARVTARPPALPATEADFREILGQGYAGLARYEKSIRNQRRVLKIREELHPGASPDVASAAHQLAASLWWSGEYDEAEGLYRRSLEMRRELHGAEHEEIAASLTHLAACHLKQGRTAEAEALYAEALAMRIRLQGERSPEVAASLNNLAKCVKERADLVRAERLFRDALEMITDLAGPDDLNTASAAHNLAGCLLEMGHASRAATYYSHALEVRLRKLPASHTHVASSRLGLARARFAEAPGDEPLGEAGAALETIVAGIGADHPDVAEASAAVGEMLMALGRAGEAEGLLRRALGVARAPVEVARARIRLGECLLAVGQTTEAGELLLMAYDSLGAAAEQQRLRGRAAAALKGLYLGRGDPAAATRFDAAIDAGAGFPGQSD